MSTSKRTVVSLFSGAGGFDSGFHQAGFITKLAVEIKDSPARTIAHNLSLDVFEPDRLPKMRDLPALIHGDVRAVDFSALRRLKPDVLIGGPPCQDFSLSKGSKREGLDGGRGRLYLEFLRALMFLQPKMFVFENVPGFTSANGGLAYQTVLDDLRNLDIHRKQALKAHEPIPVPKRRIENYLILFNGVVDAPAVGVPQTRRRLIIVGLRSDMASRYGAMDSILREPIIQALQGVTNRFRRFPLTVLEAFEGQPLSQLQEKYACIMRDYQSLSDSGEFQRAVDWSSDVYSKLTMDVIKDYYASNLLNFDAEYDPDEFESAMSDHEDLLRELGWLGVPVTSVSDGINVLPKQAPEIVERMHRIPPGENATFVDDTPWQVESKEISFIYRRPWPLRPAWTVMAYGGGGTYGYHYERARQMLTLRERARIQTFPDDWEFLGPEVRAQIGEAVPPLLGRRIAEALNTVLDHVDEPSENDGSRVTN